ncbi:hypothetical protein ACJIZ3_000920 [Penstemon smallii]|uniref:Exopolyphosphatase n=1 Tax=Penstemon smallii TaxID=265156 RepID=A0ABD3U564_9LAMI
MSTNSPLPPTTTTTASNLFAAVDMGTNSFKLTLVRIDPSSRRLIILHRLRRPVLLGLDASTSALTTTLSSASLNRSISALLKFKSYLHSHRLTPSHLRLVATSAVRESSNNSEFIRTINETLGYNVEIISGTEEARFTYLGILQFFPLFKSRVLAIDIGGGSTEFTVGFEGNVLFSKSLRLGHVTLSKEFTDVTGMREHIRNVLEKSGLIEKIKEFKIDVVVGSSGTIKAIEKAASRGYTREVEENVGVSEDLFKRQWKFSREELRCLMEKLCNEEEMGLAGKVRRVGFFKGRAEFILAGTILLNEVFERLEIEEIEVSGYALGEGVITEMLERDFEGFDLNVNARWRSVGRLASRFNNKKRMRAATMCAGIAREIFEGLRRTSELCDDEFSMPLDDMDLEYLEAASLLHNIGLCTGEKGYHKKSYRVIVNGDHLHGYTKEEIKLIAFLVRHHRKKFPSDALDGSTNEKFKLLCTILRVSVTLQRYLPVNFQTMEFLRSSEGFKLVLSEGEARNQSPGIVEWEPLLSEGINSHVEKELEHFKMVFKKSLSVVTSSSS